MLKKWGYLVDLGKKYVWDWIDINAENYYTGVMKNVITNKRACYFLSLKVENVACFGIPQSLDLSNGKGEPARWTVIIGDNGVGKTTLLRCLAGISPYSINEPDSMIFRIPTLNWRFKKEGQLSSLIEAHFAVDWKFTEKEKKFITVNRNYSEGLISGKSSSNELTQAVHSYSTVVGSEPLFKELNFICHGYGAARRMSSPIISTEKKEFTTRSLFDDDAPLINVEEWLLQADYIFSKDPKYLSYKKQVEEIILHLLPGVTNIDYRVGNYSTKVMFETPSGWVGMKELSLGYRTMLSWIVDFAASLFDRYPDSENPLEEPAVLLVDEIDLHLHPKWQRTIIDYLTQKFPNTQFIVTAHSPIMVQSAVGANMVLLKRDGKNIVIDNNPVSVENWRVDQILTSDLFGLDSVRSRETQNVMDERTRILSKRKLNQGDNLRLAELESTLGAVPFGDTKEEIAADYLIKEIAKKISQRDNSKP